MTFENVFENTPHIQYSKSHRPYTAGQSSISAVIITKLFVFIFNY